MRKILEAFAGSYDWYKARRPEYDTGEKIPFRVSPEPLKLEKNSVDEIKRIGQEVAQYIQTISLLYQQDENVRKILNTGKPEIFLSDRTPNYLFIRPDLVITPAGFSICEVETSPFGLALAELLNKSYISAGFETLVEQNALSEYVQETAPHGGTLLFSPKTQSYAGQLTFLADKVFSNGEPSWNAQKINEQSSSTQQNIYRGFYLSEYLTNPDVRALLESYSQDESASILPSLTPYLEEKAVLAFLWDQRYETFLKKELGDAAFHHLQTVVPPTWVVGQEEFFSPGLPEGISSSVDLATLSRSKRTLVLKPSGFNPKSSWSEGVHFLHEKSADKAKEILHAAEQDTSAVHIIQDFRKGMNIPMFYENPDGSTTCMQARVRVTPYISLDRGNEGKLIAIKATGCENTDYIHASSSSINTAVAQE
jgi:hypothetical protein